MTRGDPQAKINHLQKGDQAKKKRTSSSLISPSKSPPSQQQQKTKRKNTHTHTDHQINKSSRLPLHSTLSLCSNSSPMAFSSSPSISTGNVPSKPAIPGFPPARNSLALCAPGALSSPFLLSDPSVPPYFPSRPPRPHHVSTWMPYCPDIGTRSRKKMSTSMKVATGRPGHARLVQGFIAL